MKSMKIDKIISFPFPAPPNKRTILEAEKRLVLLGALDVNSHLPGKLINFMFKLNVISLKLFLEITNITPLGKSMAAFPLSPHYAKMLCLSKDRILLQYMLFIISAMSVQEYLPGDHVEAWKKTKLSWVDKGEFLLLGNVKSIFINLKYSTIE